MRNKPDFKFFVPATIEKSKGKDGKEEMLIQGVASTRDEDSDGEFLDPSGYDLDYFNKYGFFNWQHRAKQDPTAIVGEPVEAKIKNGQFWVKGKLFEDNPLAVGIYKLAKSLSSSNRHLGFSIEGKALERDILNPKIVKKAKITGIAITPTPKNSNTFMDICKGEYQEYDDDYEEEASIFDSKTANGGTEHLLDITTPTGDRIIVTKSYEAKVIAKSLNTENGAPLAKESLEGSPKNTSYSKKKPSKALTKSEVYVDIFKSYPDVELDAANQIFDLIVDVQTKINSEMKTPTPEAIEAAKEILKAASNDIEKAAPQGSDADFPVHNQGGSANQGATDDANGASQSDFDKACGLMKACAADNKDMSKEDMYKAVKDKMKDISEDDMSKAYDKYSSDMKKSDEEEEKAPDVDDENKKDEQDKKDPEMSKSEELELLKSQQSDIQSRIDALEKAEDTTDKPVDDLNKSEDNDIIKAINAQSDVMSKKFEAIGTLHGSLSDNLNKAFREIRCFGVRAPTKIY